jgi:pimeloyl-ACP methyl ester carboxylesterase
MTTYPRSMRVTIGGTGIRWLEWGREDAPAILCVHGSFGVAESFARFAEHVCADYRVIAPDLRGHGQSDWVDEPGGYAPAAVAGDIAALVRCVGLTAIHLVGLSLGGLVACEFARLQAQQLRSVTLVDIAPALAPKAQAGLRAGFNYPRSFASLDAALAWASPDDLWTEGPALEDDLRSRLRQVDNGRWMWRADERFFAPANRALWFGAPEQFWLILERLVQPIMLMRAGRSPLLSDACVMAFAARVREPRVVTLDDAQHSIPISHPSAFAREVIAFVSGIR